MSYADLEEYKKSIEKQLEDADKKLAENTATIQKLNHEKERKDKEIFDLEAAVQVVIGIVKPLQPGVFDGRSVMDCLREVPTCMAGYMTGTSKSVAKHVLGLVRSWFPQLDLSSLGRKFPRGYTAEQYQANI